MRICDYCFQESEGQGACPFCQSASFDSESVSQLIRGEPCHYNGYVIWGLAGWTYDRAEYLFYLGDRLVERFTISRGVLRMFVPEHQTVLPFIWDLFLLAQGEEEVLRVTEQNTIKPAVFEITLMPTPEEEWATGLSIYDVWASVAAGERRITCLL